MAAASDLFVASKLLAVFLLVMANGFFVAAEFALVVVRRSRVDQLVAEGRSQARALQRALQHLDSYLAATQLGVTMASLGLGWLGEPAIAAVIEPAFHALLPEPLATLSAHTLGVVFAFTIITSLHIVLGELAPKSLALQRPERTALFVIRLLELYLMVFRPVVFSMNSVGNWVLKLLGLRTGNVEDLIHSPEELKLLVSASREAGLLEETQEDVVGRVFRLGEQRVSFLMTPRIDMFWLDSNDPITELQEQVIASVDSHFLVCNEMVEQPIGFLRAKEFLAARLTGGVDLTNFQQLLTPILYVPESIPALQVLELFKVSGDPIAIVVDEYGSIQGMVTLNDLLEAIVGDLNTGDELEDPQATRLEDGAWLLDGMLSIEDFKELFELHHWPELMDPDYQTVGGFVLYQLGYIPAQGEAFEWEGFSFEVVVMEGHRIGQVRVIPPRPQKPA